MKNELSTIVDNDIRDFCIAILEKAPDYFYTVGASTSGKYHPQYALGEGGLIRHTIAATNILNYFLELEQYKNIFSEREADCMRCAIILHDTEKLGRNGSQYTVHEHPILAADTIRSYKDASLLHNNELEFIASLIETHMGQWNVSNKSSLILPKPESEAQKLVHLADYLASRKKIEFIFDKVENDINTFVMPFGKYKGELLVDVAWNNPDYIIWLQGNCNLQEPLATFIRSMIK